MAQVRTRSAAYGKALAVSLEANANGPASGYEVEVASIAVMDGTKLLMGRRRDSGRWTLPGGHLEGGEDPHEGALRELKEEAGIDAHQLAYLGSQAVITELGKTVMIHAYHLTACPTDVTSAGDPDGEVQRWRWIETRNGLPPHVASNLHAKRNVTLMLLDIYRSFGSELYVTDLLKAAGHKYLRKYKGRNGEWVYVYHEAGQHGRALKPEAVQHLHELAQLGHGDARSLVDSTEAHDEGKLKALRELADLGHQPAHEHLKTLGIDRAAEKKHEEKEKAEKKRREAAKEAERQILGDNELTRKLQGQDLNELHEHVVKTVKEKIFDHLAGHATTPIGRALQQSGLSVGDVTGGIGPTRSVADTLKALHEDLKRIDTALAGQTSANSTVLSAGGYGNMAYNAVVDGMVTRGYLPEAARAHRRKAEHAQTTLELPGDMRNQARGLGERREGIRREAHEREVREREARERETRERAAAEQRAMQEAAGAMERHRDNVDKLIKHSRSRLSEPEKHKLALGIQKFFGSDWNFGNWLQSVQHPDNRVETKISINPLDIIAFANQRGAHAEGSIAFSYHMAEKETGQTVMSASRSIIRKPDGSLELYNQVFSPIPVAMREKYKNIASAVYDGSEKMLKEASANFTGEAKKKTRVKIGSCANSGFSNNGYKGAIVWAKHRYDWAEPDREKPEWKSTYKDLLGRHGETLGIPAADIETLKRKIDTFEYPYQFVEMGYGLSIEQMSQVKRGFDRQPAVDPDIQSIVRKNGSYDLGSWLLQMWGHSWPGVNYVNDTTGRPGHLSGDRERKRQQQRDRPAQQAPARKRKAS